MAKKTYVVAEGMAFTAMGHIFGAGEEIPESAFSDKVYMSKMISEKKIVEKKSEAVAEEKAEEPAETPAGEKAEEPAEVSGTKKSTAKGGK